MARTIFRIGSNPGFLAASFQRGFWGDELGSVKRIVVDGDTVNVSSNSNFPIRFLGIDTPESSFFKPGTDTFASTDSEEFVALLSDPFGDGLQPLDLPQELQTFLRDKACADAAQRQKDYAEEAEDALEALIQTDFDELGVDRFFLAFAFEALDGFGRLLAYVHPEQKDTPAADRRPSFNERLLDSGAAYPYFIFPNVDPFRSRGSPIEAAAMASSPQAILQGSPRLRRARQSVAQAREQGLGVFNADRPNLFEPFELRFLARRSPPSRWLIDLSAEESVILEPTQYPQIPKAEDRLWLPPEFVPLFQMSGWTLAGDTQNIMASTVAAQT